MKKITPQNLKGFRDFLPKEAAIKNRLISIVRDVFESFGFEPLETPALEYAETLAGKYGEDADKLLYQFKDRGDREVALRYDLTVPLARVVAQNPELPKPFKRYQIAPVWRADKPQKGRYREFTQCDIDIVGSTSPLADAEVITVLYTVFEKIGIKDFKILVNSRKVLFGVMQEAGVPEAKRLSVIRTIDKLDKMTEQEVELELKEKGLSGEEVKKIFRSLKNAEKEWFLKEVLARVSDMGVPEKALEFKSFLARGIDYYTGPIYEVEVKIEGKPWVSLGGGGRYDKLVGMFSKNDVPACGVSIGIDRVMEVIMEQKLWKDAKNTVGDVLVASTEEKFLPEALKLTSLLRTKNINTEIFLDFGAKLDKQLAYADKKGIRFAVILGADEMKKKKVVLKDLNKRTQANVLVSGLATMLKKRIAG